MLLVFAGCSGRPKNIARKVSGKITLGGQPLAGALVMFTPVEAGSPSVGRTDSGGNYNLVWAQTQGRKIEGAQIGEHVVKISTFADSAATATPSRQEVAEKVPYKYRVESPPTATVTKGVNVINIELEPGPVDPPPQPKTKGKVKTR